MRTRGAELVGPASSDEVAGAGATGGLEVPAVWSRRTGRPPTRSHPGPSLTRALQRSRRTDSVPSGDSPSRIRPGTRSSNVVPSMTGGLNDTWLRSGIHLTTIGWSVEVASHRTIRLTPYCPSTDIART